MTSPTLEQAITEAHRGVAAQFGSRASEGSAGIIRAAVTAAAPVISALAAVPAAAPSHSALPAPGDRPRVVLSNAFARALADAGVIHDDLDRIHRIVIVVQSGQPVAIYTEHIGDTRLVDLAELLPVMPVDEPAGPIGDTTP